MASLHSFKEELVSQYSIAARHDSPGCKLKYKDLTNNFERVSDAFHVLGCCCCVEARYQLFHSEIKLFFIAENLHASYYSKISYVTVLAKLLKYPHS